MQAQTRIRFGRLGPMPSQVVSALALTLALTTVDAAPAEAQPYPTVLPGSRVRITSPTLGLNRVVGTVEETSDAELVIRFTHPRSVGTVARSDISEMDVSTKRERHVLRGLGRGLLIGAAGGAVLGLAGGALTQSDVWSPILPTSAQRFAVNVSPAVGEAGTGLQVGLSLRLR